MKKVLALILSLLMIVSITACAKTPAPAEPSAADAEPLPVVELRLWGAENDQELLTDLSNEFIAKYADVADIKVEVGVESESTAKDTVLTDIEAAADVFAFADDQIMQLVNAGALQSIDAMDEVLQAYAGKSVADLKAENNPGAITAATVKDTLYAIPKEGGNGFFLYYDSTAITEEQASTWMGLLDAAQAAGKKVGMTLSSGWYNAGFFLGAGFKAQLNEDGSTMIDWNGTSPQGISGVDVTKAMLEIAAHPAFQAVPDGGLSAAIASGELCAVVSGTWDADPAKEAFGEGYSAKVLPTFEAGGKTVQQFDFCGFKLIGINAYSKNVGWATLLGEYIVNEDAQRLRFAAHNSLPTNLEALKIPEIQDNVALTAIAAQDEFGMVQTVGGNYWGPTGTFGEMIAQGQLKADDDAAIQEALDTMVEGVGAPVA